MRDVPFYLDPSRWFCREHRHTMLVVRNNRTRVGEPRAVRRVRRLNPDVYCPRCSFVKPEIRAGSDLP